MKFQSLFFFSCLATGVLGQVSQGGEPRRLGHTSLINFADVHIPDVEALLARDRVAAQNGSKVGYVAEVIKRKIPISEFESVKVEDGIVYAAELKSPGAFRLQVNFDRFHLPFGAVMFLYSKNETRGGFNEVNHKSNGQFSVAPLVGDSVVVEIFSPVVNGLNVTIGSIAHHYHRGFGESDWCNVNAVCHKGWENEQRAVGALATRDGERYCTGALIVNKNFKQYFATATHCAGGENDIVIFNYKSATCENPTKEPSTADSAQGLTLIYEGEEPFVASKSGPYLLTDVSVFEIKERIPASYDLYLTGYNAVNEKGFAGAYSLSHPYGDILKLGLSNPNEIATQDAYIEGETKTHWFINHWIEGVTEPGSSGSPIFDEEKRSRGVLTGGYANCDSPYKDWYGGFWAAWKAKGYPHGKTLEEVLGGRLTADGINLNDARNL